LNIPNTFSADQGNLYVSYPLAYRYIIGRFNNESIKNKFLRPFIKSKYMLGPTPISSITYDISRLLSNSKNPFIPIFNLHVSVYLSFGWCSLIYCYSRLIQSFCSSSSLYLIYFLISSSQIQSPPLIAFWRLTLNLDLNLHFDLYIFIDLWGVVGELLWVLDRLILPCYWISPSWV
jgi:hypothetical protein